MFNNFEEIANEINERGNVRVELDNTYKNGEKRNVLKVMDKTIAPIYYLEDHDLERDVEEIESLLVSVSEKVPFELNIMEKIKDINNVKYKILPYDYYKEELKEKNLFYTLHENGLAEIYFIEIGAGATVSISKDLIKENNWKLKEIIENAHINMYQKLRIKTMHSVLTTMLDIDIPDEENNGMYIVTTDNMLWGGAYITDKEAICYISRILKTDEFYIIPSSIHELLVITNPDMDIEELKKMVQEVNDTQVEPGDRLSYNVWKYEKGDLIKF